jgi:hypothetical protein
MIWILFEEEDLYGFQEFGDMYFCVIKQYPSCGDEAWL